MSHYVGVDVGSFSCKAAVLDEDRVVGAVVSPSGTDYAVSARRVFEEALSIANIESCDAAVIVATGIGAKRLDFATSVTGEVITAARGIFLLAPAVRTLIDIGAQATRVIWLDDQGRVANFAANEKCATGSGRFLQIIANVLRVDLEELGGLSQKASAPAMFNTGCAVFGESEAITRVSEGVAREDLVAGVHRSLAEKIASLVRGRGRGLEGDCAVIGGGALDVGLLGWLEKELGAVFLVPKQPQLVGAIGAAVQGRREVQSLEATPQAAACGCS